jgi:hypothetical protein
MGPARKLGQVILDHPGDENRVDLKQRHPPEAEIPVLQHRVKASRAVKSQVNAVMTKLGARNRTIAVSEVWNTSWFSKASPNRMNLNRIENPALRRAFDGIGHNLHVSQHGNGHRE